MEMEPQQEDRARQRKKSLKAARSDKGKEGDEREGVDRVVWCGG
jgi:hypothetical protein